MNHVDMIWGYNLDYAKINFIEGKEIQRTQRMAQKLFVRSRIFWCKPVIISVLQKQTTAFNVFFSFGNLIATKMLMYNKTDKYFFLMLLND